MSNEGKADPIRDRSVTLSPDEEITLRRVAFGESLVRSMRAQDLDRLRRLQLIGDGKDGPTLTASGRRHFDTLPKAVALSDHGPQDLLRAMTQMPKKEVR